MREILDQVRSWLDDRLTASLPAHSDYQEVLELVLSPKLHLLYVSTIEDMCGGNNCGDALEGCVERQKGQEGAFASQCFETRRVLNTHRKVSQGRRLGVTLETALPGHHSPSLGFVVQSFWSDQESVAADGCPPGSQERLLKALDLFEFLTTSTSPGVSAAVAARSVEIDIDTGGRRFNRLQLLPHFGIKFADAVRATPVMRLFSPDSSSSDLVSFRNALHQLDVKQTDSERLFRSAGRCFRLSSRNPRSEDAEAILAYIGYEEPARFMQALCDALSINPHSLADDSIRSLVGLLGLELYECAVRALLHDISTAAEPVQSGPRTMTVKIDGVVTDIPKESDDSSGGALTVIEVPSCAPVSFACKPKSTPPTMLHPAPSQDVCLASSLTAEMFRQHHRQVFDWRWCDHLSGDAVSSGVSPPWAELKQRLETRTRSTQGTEEPFDAWATWAAAAKVEGLRCESESKVSESQPGWCSLAQGTSFEPWRKYCAARAEAAAGESWSNDSIQILLEECDEFLALKIAHDDSKHGGAELEAQLALLECPMLTTLWRHMFPIRRPTEAVPESALRNAKLREFYDFVRLSDGHNTCFSTDAWHAVSPSSEEPEGEVSPQKPADDPAAPAATKGAKLPPAPEKGFGNARLPPAPGGEEKGPAAPAPPSLGARATPRVGPTLLAGGRSKSPRAEPFKKFSVRNSRLEEIDKFLVSSEKVQCWDAAEKQEQYYHPQAGKENLLEWRRMSHCALPLDEVCTIDHWDNAHLTDPTTLNHGLTNWPDDFSGLPTAIDLDEIHQQFSEDACKRKDLRGQFQNIKWVSASRMQGMLSAPLPGRLSICGVVEPSSICQGLVGNCWLISAIAVLAEFEKPIRDVFRKCCEAQFNIPQKKCDGPYELVLHDPYNKFKQQIVEINDQVPCYRGGRRLRWRPCFASTTALEIWPMLLEKGIAKMLGGFHKLAGNHAPLAWAIITGETAYGVYFPWGNDGDTDTWGEGAFSNMDNQPSYWAHQARETNCFNDEVVWQSFRLMDVDGKLMACTFKGVDGSIGPGKRDCDRKGSTGVSSDAGDGLVAGHTYSLIDVKLLTGGLKLLWLRNPWGNEKEWKGAWSDGSEEWKKYPEVAEELDHHDAADGLFYMAWEDFKSRVSEIVFSKTSSPTTFGLKFGPSSSGSNYQWSNETPFETAASVPIDADCWINMDMIDPTELHQGSSSWPDGFANRTESLDAQAFNSDIQWVSASKLPALLMSSSSDLEAGKNISLRKQHCLSAGYDLLVCDSVDISIAPGNAGDCWLVAAITALAQHPLAIKNVFRDCPRSALASTDGPYEMLLHNPFDSFRRVSQRINDRVPCYARYCGDHTRLAGWRPCFASAIDSNEMWPSLLAKGISVLLGGYHELNGRRAPLAWAIITGRTNYRVYFPWPGRTQALRSSHWGEGSFDLSVSTSRYKYKPRPQNRLSPDAIWESLCSKDLAGNLIACSFSAIQGSGDHGHSDGLISDYLYSLVAVKHVYEEGNTSKCDDIEPFRLLQFQSPWGNAHVWTGRWSPTSKDWNRFPSVEAQLRGEGVPGNGLFWMSWEDFQTRVAEVVFSDDSFVKLFHKTSRPIISEGINLRGQTATPSNLHISTSPLRFAGSSGDIVEGPSLCTCTNYFREWASPASQNQPSASGLASAASDCEERQEWQNAVLERQYSTLEGFEDPWTNTKVEDPASLNRELRHWDDGFADEDTSWNCDAGHNVSWISASKIRGLTKARASSGRLNVCGATIPFGIMQGHARDVCLSDAFVALTDFAKSIRDVFELCPQIAHSNADFPYVLTLYDPKDGFRKRTLEINDRVPIYRSEDRAQWRPGFTSTLRDEIWPMLLEKGIAVLLEGYHNLVGNCAPLMWATITGDQHFCVFFPWGDGSSGLWGKGTFSDLSNRPRQYSYKPQSLNTLEEQQIWESLRLMDVDGHLMACSFKKQKPLKSTILTILDEGGASDGLSPHHLYPLVAAKMITDSSGLAHRFLQFRNPWAAASEWIGRWSEKSEVWQKCPDVAAQLRISEQPSEETRLFWMCWEDWQDRVCQVIFSETSFTSKFGPKTAGATCPLWSAEIPCETQCLTPPELDLWNDLDTHDPSVFHVNMCSWPDGFSDLDTSLDATSYHTDIKWISASRIHRLIMHNLTEPDRVCVDITKASRVLQPIDMRICERGVGGIFQGSLGSSWLTAAVAALVGFPQIIKSVFGRCPVSPHRRADGPYPLVLHDPWDSFRKKSVVINDRVPCYSRYNNDPKRLGAWRPCYAFSLDPREVWPMLLEKGIAQLMGGYQCLNSHHAPFAWAILTGCCEYGVFFKWQETDGSTQSGKWGEGSFALSDTSRAYTYQRRSKNVIAGDAVWDRLSFMSHAGHLLACTFKSTEPTVTRDPDLEPYLGLLPHHAYAVVVAKSMSERLGSSGGAVQHRLVQLQSPWPRRQDWKGRCSKYSSLGQQHPQVEEIVCRESQGLFWMDWEGWQDSIDYVVFSRKPFATECCLPQSPPPLRAPVLPEPPRDQPQHPLLQPQPQPQPGPQPQLQPKPQQRRGRSSTRSRSSGLSSSGPVDRCSDVRCSALSNKALRRLSGADTDIKHLLERLAQLKVSLGTYTGLEQLYSIKKEVSQLVAQAGAFEGEGADDVKTEELKSGQVPAKLRKRDLCGRLHVLFDEIDSTVLHIDSEVEDLEAKALSNYEQFHGLSEGTASKEQVASSAARLAGWAQAQPSTVKQVRYSTLSKEALLRLSGADTDIKHLLARLAQLQASVGTSTDLEKLYSIKNELIQFNAQAEAFQSEVVDDVKTGELKSGQVTAKLRKRDLGRLFDKLFEEIDSTFRQIEGEVKAKAHYNYEQYYGLPEGTATHEQVASSALKLAGWAKAQSPALSQAGSPSMMTIGNSPGDERDAQPAAGIDAALGEAFNTGGLPNTQGLEVRDGPEQPDSPLSFQSRSRFNETTEQQSNANDQASSTSDSGKSEVYNCNDSDNGSSRSKGSGSESGSITGTSQSSSSPLGPEVAQVSFMLRQKDEDRYVSFSRDLVWDRVVREVMRLPGVCAEQGVQSIALTSIEYPQRRTCWSLEFVVHTYVGHDKEQVVHDLESLFSADVYQTTNLFKYFSIDRPVVQPLPRVDTS